MQQKVCPRRGEYFVMNRNELLGCFFFRKEELIRFYVNVVKRATVMIVAGLIL